MVLASNMFYITQFSNNAYIGSLLHSFSNISLVCTFVTEIPVILISSQTH